MNKKQLSVALLGGVMIGAVGFTAVGANAQQLTDEQKVERQEQKEEILSGKVEDGTITQEQKTQITEFMQERIAEKEADKGDRLTKEDWKALSDEEKSAFKEEKMADREAMKAEVEAFFEEIGVDKEDLFDGSTRGKRGSGKKGNHFNKNVEAIDVEETTAL